MDTWTARAIRKQIKAARLDHSDFVIGIIEELEKNFRFEWQMQAYTRTFANLDTPDGVKLKLVAKCKNLTGSYETTTTFRHE